MNARPVQRAGAEHVLEVERAEQEQAEDRARGASIEAAADGAVGEPLEPQRRLRRRRSNRGRSRPVRGGRAAEASVCVEVQPALWPCEIA